jgi:arylsulfatase A-like enzyme
MNVIWMVADTVRIDAVGVYGNKKMHTPALDALAAKSVRFNRHYIASFPTMPARADFMTGRWTMSFMQWEPLPKSEVTLAELIASSDINTAAIVDTPFFLRDGMGYDRGFLTFNEIPGHYYVAKGGGRQRMDAVDVRPTYRLEADCFAPQTFAKAMQWLELHYKDNFFLYIDTWDPHEPWNPPNYYTELYWPNYDGEMIGPVYGYIKDRPGFTAERVRKAQATYFGEMTMVDNWIGNLLRQVENMGLMDNTAIIFTTDHGYNFNEHGGLYGKMVFAQDPEQKQGRVGAWARSPLYNEVTLIPLIIYVPGVKPATYNGLTSAVDLMPTVLDIMGQEIPSHVEGRSLLPALKDPSLAGRDYVIGSLPFINAGDTDLSVDHIRRRGLTTSMSTVITKEWSFLYDPEPGGSELYNLLIDPGEETNVISQHPDLAREYHQLFVNFMRETKVPKRLMDTRLELRL